jgi:hypothetical protein
VWVEKDWQGGWSAFGGGGCIFSEIRTADFCLVVAVLTYQLMPKLQIGAELFHRTADFQGNPASSSVGVGWRYDLSKNFHLLDYILGEELRTRNKQIAIPGTHPFCSPSEAG